MQKQKTNWDAFRRKKENFRVFDFVLHPKSKTQKSRKVLFSNFGSSCNLRFRNDKNELIQKLKVIKWIKKKQRKLPKFPSFLFCSIPKIENSEISESVRLLQILTVFVTFSEFAFSANRVKPCFLWLLILSHTFLKILLKFLTLFRRYSDFLVQYYYFRQFFGFCDIFLLTRRLLSPGKLCKLLVVTKNLMTSNYFKQVV